MQILNIAGYKFTHLPKHQELRSHFMDLCASLKLKGTILLSEEGINLNLAGTQPEIDNFRSNLTNQAAFHGMTFRESYSSRQPFKRLKVKLKKEIITMRKPAVDAVCTRAPSLAPLALKQWLDEGKDILLLDTRNDYEIRFGTFKGAVNLYIDHFVQFPASVSALNKTKPVVMFCTGGIRCEKAGLYLLQEGFQEVYQLEGGILNYFAQAGGAHYEGDCYVFDERIALNASLEASGVLQCVSCNGPVTVAAQAAPAFILRQHCPGCG